MRTQEEHAKHVQCQQLVTLLVLGSIVAAEVWPDFQFLCTGLEVGAVLTWIWIE